MRRPLKGPRMLTGLYIGIMSGTSLDGADAILAEIGGPTSRSLDHVHVPFPGALREQLEALCSSGPDEIHRSQVAALELARIYARCVQTLLGRNGCEPQKVIAIGCHGQTVRHMPSEGYTVQLNAPAALAEMTGIRVVSDFRSRDIAAGGQGAPLVPAFHAAMFGTGSKRRAILNLGGMSNVTLIAPDTPVQGFDCGPANVLMDAWIRRHQDLGFDEGGRWAASGQIDPALLGRLLAHPFFAQRPPKSCGREQFNPDWLASVLQGEGNPADVQATLAELTAESVAAALRACDFAPDEVLACGGGALNTYLMSRLALRIGAPVRSTAEAGIPPEQVEAFAFAWLAMQAMTGRTGNLPDVTGAAGPRVLGALWPA